MARGVLEYVRRNLRDPAGGFHAAEDADSAVEAGGSRLTEGAYYVWTADQIRRVLGPDRAAVFLFPVDAMLEDYAFLIQGLLDLYEASFEPKWARQPAG